MLTPNDEKIRSQLASILTSKCFAGAARPRRFLEYVVNQTLEGHQDSIKESVLGAAVFDRPPDFDPRADAIVRVEATKLRARLADYYTGPGQGDEVLIEIPKGSYVPRFGARSAFSAQTSVPSRPRWLWLAGLAAIVLAGSVAAVLRQQWLSPEPEAPSIAVLPFLNLSSDAENEYFSDGLAEQLTDVLTQAQGLRVASRTSAFSFRGQRVSAEDIGAKLHVANIVEGSVRKSGDQIRVTAQLIRTKDGYHLWSKTFEHSAQDIFALQDELSQQIAYTLNATLAEDARRHVLSRYTKDPQALELYLRGRHAVQSFEPEAGKRANELFQQALQRDPSFTMAHVGVATAALQGNFTGLGTPSEIADAARASAQTALELDPSLAEAHALLADVTARFDWKWEQAESGFRRALSLNPRAADAHQLFAADVLLPLGRYEEALAECRAAMDLDPVTPQIQLCRPWVLSFQNPEQGVAESKLLLASQPNHSGFLGGLGIAHLRAGHFREAAEIFERLRPETTPSAAGSLIFSYGRAGRTADAARLEKQWSKTLGTASAILVQMGLGRFDQARIAAERQIQERSGNALYLPIDPIFEVLRAEPEFAAKLQVIGLPIKHLQ